MKTPRSRSGFTLTELLVVIAIIAVLAALLVTVTGKIKQRSQAAKCAGGMRQIGIAMLAYAGENNGTLPAPGITSPQPRSWFEAIQPNLNDSAFDTRAPDQTLCCPVWLGIFKKDFPAATHTDWRRTGYGMSYVMVGSPTTGWPTGFGTSRATRLAELQDPVRTIMVAEDDSWSWGLHSQNYTSSSYFNASSKDKRGNRHGKGSNFLFADGHVQQLDKESVAPYLAR